MLIKVAIPALAEPLKYKLMLRCLTLFPMVVCLTVFNASFDTTLNGICVWGINDDGSKVYAWTLVDSYVDAEEWKEATQRILKELKEKLLEGEK